MADCMGFPDDWRDFLHDYEFKDKQEIYTNGAMLIPSFRVEQMMEHYLPNIVHCRDCWAFVDRHGKRIVGQDFGYCGAYGSTSHVTTAKEFCYRGSTEPHWLKK